MPNTLQKSPDDAITGHCGKWDLWDHKNTSGKYVHSAEVLYLLVQSLKVSGAMRYSSLKLFKIKTYNFFFFLRNGGYSREMFRERERGLLT